MKQKLPKLAIIVRINAGLGNQLFDYAVARFLADKLGRALVLDDTEFKLIKSRQYLLDEFSLPKRELRADRFRLLYLILLCSRILQRFSWSLAKTFLSVFSIQPIRLNNSNDLANAIKANELTNKRRFIYMIGTYWGRMDLLPPRAELRKMLSLQCSRETQESNGREVSIHVRRTDFVAFNIDLPIDYYIQAIALMKTKVKDPLWYVFSDDIEWCRKNLPHLENVTFVEGDNRNPVCDLQKIIDCQHHIIANSSFSWWAAYLADESGITICPSTYLYDLKAMAGINVPQNWTIINVHCDAKGGFG